MNKMSEPEATPGEEQHPGQAGPARRGSDAWRGCWRQRRNAGDDQRRPSRTSQRRCNEGSSVSERCVSTLLYSILPMIPTVCSSWARAPLMAVDPSSCLPFHPGFAFSHVNLPCTGKRMPTGGPMRGRGFASRMAMRRGGRHRGGVAGRGGALLRGAARGGIARGQG